MTAKHETVHAALVAAQGEFPAIPKTKTADTGKYKYTYAALEDIITAVRPVLLKHGLGFSQNALSTDDAVGVQTIIVHESGTSIISDPLLLPAGNTAQTAGSALTYARRYSLAAALGIATEEDDDGTSASQTTGPSRAPQPNKEMTPKGTAGERGAGGPAGSNEYIAVGAVKTLEREATRLAEEHGAMTADGYLELALHNHYGEEIPVLAEIRKPDYAGVLKELKALG